MPRVLSPSVRGLLLFLGSWIAFIGAGVLLGGRDRPGTEASVVDVFAYLLAAFAAVGVLAGIWLLWTHWSTPPK